MPELSLTVQGDKDLIAKLRKFGIAILDLKPEFEETGRYLTRFFGGEVFASRGRVIGRPWQPLSPAYAAYKARQWPGRPPLVRTGLMQRSFKHQSTALSARIFNDVTYFEYHQDGRGVPERVMMLLDEQRQRAVLTYLGKGVQRALESSDV